MAIQGGAGVGTVAKQRRKPANQETGVQIMGADGLSLGPDGNVHPIETRESGELKASEATLRDTLAVIADDLKEIKELMRVLVNLWDDGNDYAPDELVDVDERTTEA